MRFHTSIRKILLLVALMSPSSVFAQANMSTCSARGYTVEAINGVLTNENGAAKNLNDLRSYLPNVYNGEPVTSKYLLNPMHLGGIGDLIDSVDQKALENETVEDYDLIEILRDASAKVHTQKLLLVAHSQGNFYANSFYDIVSKQTTGASAQSLGIYGIATPASRVAGNGKWLTSDTDKVIAGVVAHIPFKRIMTPNAHIALSPTDDFWGHDLVKIYLPHLGSKIRADIRDSLAKLSADPNRSEGSLCIDLPPVTLSHKIEGAILSVVDPIANPLSVAIMWIGGKTISGTAFAINTIADGINNFNTNSGLGHSALLGRLTNTANNNSASVLLALDQEPLPAVAGEGTPPLIENPGISDISLSTSAEGNAVENANEPASDAGITNPSQQTEIEATSSVDASSTAHLAIAPAIDLGGGTLASATTTSEVKDDQATTTERAAPETTTTETFSYISGANPSAPVDTTLPNATTTFSGTYSNNAMFDTLTFELKNVSLGTATTSVQRLIATTTGEGISYSEEIGLTGEGVWQYRVRLEDSINASSTPWSSFLNFSFIPAVPEIPIVGSHTQYIRPFIGTPIDVGGGWSSGSSATFTSSNRDEDVYRVRVKKASEFDCKKDAIFGFLVSGFSPVSQRIAEFDISNATTSADGMYCEYPFTKEHISVPPSAGLSYINFIATHNGSPAFLDGSYANNERTMGSDGIWRNAPTFAFQLCGVDGCDASFKLPPDGVTPTTPTKQTYLYPPVFSGTYNNNAILNTQATYENNATFNKIVFELKNVTLDTATSTIERSLSANGSVVPYREQIDVPTAGAWQYRARLEDSVNASSTPWSAQGAFTFSPRTDGNKANARTVYSQPYIGDRVDVSGGWTGNSGAVFASGSRSEDAYSIRFKKASNFDCKTDVQRGDIFYIWSGVVSNRVVSFDIPRGMDDGSYCEYPFTEDSTMIPANSSISDINFVANHNGEHAYLDGSVANEGNAKNGYGINSEASYAFQLCNIAGCNGSFVAPTGGAATSTVPEAASSTPVPSSLHSIVAFVVPVATTTIQGTIDETAHTVSLVVPFGTDVRTLAPLLIVSPLATSSPASLLAQDFTIPQTYTVTAEDGSTGTYTVTVVIAPDTSTHEAPPRPVVPDSTLPLISGYTFNGIEGDITVDFATTSSVTLDLTANKNVDWVSVTIEDENNASRDKIFFSGLDCVDGTATCRKTWYGDLSHGSVGLSATFKIKVHIKDTGGHEYEEYLSPYKILVK